uniref:ATP synthase subunit a n=1 Tax=Lepidocampa weberi TaxID=165470 RepID=U3KTJ1_9HEXA|nr:ATP synthase F0 subunit 6 [Lepidocampa weberi]AEV44877.1 ATP synthase F0 subunit 6 [Lepidocampa weberi]
MMTNLFSIFDPTSSTMSLQTNWLSIFTGLILIPMNFWLIPNRLLMTFKKIFFTLHKEFKTLIGPSFFPGMTIIPISLFTIIMLNNSLGLLPFIFTSTSHLTMTLTMALPLWLSMMIYGWINNTTHMLAHLVPQGTPPALMPFMVMIEMISNFIRPITLSVRLAANMIAGHLLMTLLGNAGTNTEKIIMITIILSQILLLVLETAVAFIQAYVFSILSTLYSSEV